MGVINDAEMGGCLFPGCCERIDVRVFFRAQYFHVMIMTVMYFVCPYLIVVFGSRFESSEPNQHDFVVDIHDAVASAHNGLSVTQVWFLAKGDKSVGQMAYAESNAHAVFCIIL